MSKRRSELSKIVRKVNRQADKQKQRERAGKIPGESEDAELARKQRDLAGWLEMHKERQEKADLAATNENNEKENDK